jgi:TPR repeat protein
MTMRFMRILLLSGLTCLAASAAAKSGTEAEAKALADAIEACDKGAAVPLDPTAEAPPVQFQELYPADFNVATLKTLQRACQAAWVGAPKQKRFELQWLRVTISLGEPGQAIWLVPQVQALSRDGSAEADYLLYKLFENSARATDGVPFPVSRDDALAALARSGEKGHLGALMQQVWIYRTGRFVKRDLKKAVQLARRAESAPPQGISDTPRDTETRAMLGTSIALMTLSEDGFSPAEQKIAFRTLDTLTQGGTGDKSGAALTYIQALRAGRGTVADPVKARTLLEGRVSADPYAVPVLASMLAKGEGGPADPKRALAMLRDPGAKPTSEAAAVLADLLLDGRVVGRQPLEAIAVLAKSWDVKNYIRLAGLLVDYQPRLDNAEQIVRVLSEAAENGDDAARMALARLKLSENSQFEDVDGGRALLKPLVDGGDRAAFWLYAGSQYGNLDSSSSRPYRRESGLSDDELRALINTGINNKEADAYLLAAKVLRRGVLWPQDDKAATNGLISAANLGNVEAMVLLGDAYDDGLGTPKNPRERLKAWRLAAEKGSLVARSKLADAFTFDSFDRLMTLEEGVTGKLVLYFNGYGRRLGGLGIGGDTMVSMELGSMFSFGSRAMEAGVPAVADAVMAAFREAPAGLEDPLLVSIGKALPDEIKVAIERKLAATGHYRGNPDGYFGPDVRKALAAWVETSGAPADVKPAALPAQQAVDAKADDAGALPADLVNRVRDRAFKDARKAAKGKADRPKLEALSQLNVLARYGDIAPRWALIRNYHQSKVVRKIVTPAEITRYSLDILVTKPDMAEKAEIEVVFVVSQIDMDGKIGVFADAVIDAIRDDARMQDALTLGGVMKQFIFMPGACDAMLTAARKAGIDGMGSDGCDDASRDALLSHAKTKGPAGTDLAARQSAMAELKAMDEEAGR